MAAPVLAPKLTKSLVPGGSGIFKGNSQTGEDTVLLAVQAVVDISPIRVVFAAVLVVPGVKVPVAEQYQILIQVAATVDTALNRIYWT